MSARQPLPAMTQALFGTDGVRGTPGRFPLDPATVARLGAALAAEAGPAPRIVIGRDTRESGEEIERLLAGGIRAAGGIPVGVGVLPTPGVAFLSARGFDAGVVISASHNPVPDNGVKILTSGGEKASRRHESRLEARVAAARDGGAAPPGPSPPATDAALADEYAAHLTSVLAGAPALDGFRIAIDCAHGATSRIAPLVLRRVGIPVIATHAEPDGRNINVGCGSTHPTALQRSVVEHGCRLGLAFDGDGDRVILVDHRGAIVDGDGVLFVCARHLRAAGRLAGNAVVATMMSNIGLELSLRGAGIAMHRCAVGDRNVREEMQRRGVRLGGEQSGHVIFADRLPTGDGLATGLEVVRVMAESGRDLADLAAGLETCPQQLVNVRVDAQPDLDEVPGMRDAIRAAEERLGERGRVLVRYSGTEPLLRIMIEGPDPATVRELAAGIADRARQHLVGEPDSEAQAAK